MRQWKPQGVKVDVRQDQTIGVHELDVRMESVSRAERLVTGGDFSGHVGRVNRGDKYICIKERHAEGQIVDFAKRTETAMVTM